MAKVLVSVRLDKPIVDQLKEISKELRWDFSKTVRYLISISYSLLHPHVRVSTVALSQFLVENEDEDGTIPVWKIVQFLSPRAVEQIEEMERMAKEESGQ